MIRKSQLAIVLLGILIGLLAGVGVFTFGYAGGASYMTDNPAACANCHVMRDQFSAWQRSSHRKAAVCNDCHAPHGLVPKYFTKALNGFNHSLAFTTGRFPDDIMANARNKRIAEGACMKCHDDITAGIRTTRHSSQLACISCHRDVGHAH